MRSLRITACHRLLVLLALPIAASVSLAAAPKDGKEDGDYVIYTEDHPLADPRPDHALIYVVRPTSMGFAIKSFFFCDDEVLGINRGSSYFFAHVLPGKHLFWSKSENVDALELEVEAGKTYYIQQHVRMGGLRARTELEVLEEAAGREALGKCKKHGTMTEAGRAKGREHVAEHKEQTREDLERRSREAEEKDAGGA